MTSNGRSSLSPKLSMRAWEPLSSRKRTNCAGAFEIRLFAAVCEESIALHSHDVRRRRHIGELAASVESAVLNDERNVIEHRRCEEGAAGSRLHRRPRSASPQARHTPADPWSCGRRCRRVSRAQSEASARDMPRRTPSRRVDARDEFATARSEPQPMMTHAVGPGGTVQLRRNHERTIESRRRHGTRVALPWSCLPSSRGRSIASPRPLPWRP